MSLFHFLSHLCKWPELDLPHDTLSYTAQDTLLPRWHLSPNLFTLLALSSAANNLLWDYIVSTEVTHFHCIKQDTNYRWLILLFRYELVNSFNWHIFEVQLKRRKNPDFMLRPFHTMWKHLQHFHVFLDASNGFCGQEWFCSHGHCCQRLLLWHRSQWWSYFLTPSLIHRVNRPLMRWHFDIISPMNELTCDVTITLSFYQWKLSHWLLLSLLLVHYFQPLFPDLLVWKHKDNFQMLRVTLTGNSLMIVSHSTISFA